MKCYESTFIKTSMAFVQDFEAVPNKCYIDKICTTVIHFSKKKKKKVKILMMMVDDGDGNL